MKKTIQYLLVSILCFSLVACSNAPTTDTETPSTTKASYTAGTYTSTKHGMKSDVVVEVTFNEDSIEDVTVVSHDESENIGEFAVATVPSEIVKHQTCNVYDVTSSATITTGAIVSAVKDCVEQAGGDVSLLETNPYSKNEEVQTFDYDVVVVGGGIAGLASAVKAQDEGASVALIEKESFVGGSSTMAEGYFFSVGDDTSDDLYNEFLRRASLAHSDQFPIDSMIRTLADNADAALDSIKSTGAQIEILKQFTSIALTKDGVIDPASRSAYLLIDSMEAHLLENGADIYTNTPATELISDESGTVVGVKSDNKFTNMVFNAKSVVLSTGDYAKNKEMMEAYIPQSANCFTITAKGNTGDGMNIAMAVGAALYDDQYVQGGPLIFNPYDIYRGSYSAPEFLKESMLVSLDGDRRMGEHEGTRPIHYSYTNHDQPDGAWSIMDSKTIAGIDYIDELIAQSDDADGVRAYKADTLVELALLADMNPEVLIRNVERYNELCAEGVDEDFNKPAEFMVAINEGPYYAVRGYAMNRSTIGGIETNELGEVLNDEGQAINGLYASGLISSRAFFSRTYDGGSALGIGATMGYVAGGNAASYALD